VAAPFRVFLVGVSYEDLADLRSRVAAVPALRIVGEALRAEIDEGRAHVPSHADAVLMSRAASGAEAASPVTQAARSSAPRLFEELTPRERDVLALLSDGYGNRVIAERLGLSEHTVKFHLASIYGKLGASTRTEAVRRGLELGIIDI
jgi:two-component system, NarL family, nitrate/nitrite response regulator NarL